MVGGAVSTHNAQNEVKWSKSDEWWAYEGRRLKWVAIFLISNILMALYGFLKASYEKPLLPISYPFAKAGGAMLNFNCATILIPVCRNMLSWLRTTPVNDILPLDDNIYFHKLCGIGIVVGALIHIVCHHWNFYEMLYNYQFGSSGTSYAGLMFGSFSNLTGYAILLAMVPMYVTALECVRRSKKRLVCFRCACCCCCQQKGYTLFFNTHKLWYIVIALLWLHGKSFWIYSLWPVIFALMEKVIQRKRGKRPVSVTEIHQHASDVIEIRMVLADERKLKFTAGQYLYLNCPVISNDEWHPFTLSSAPEENFFSCHIRCRKDMDWTFALRTLLNPKGEVHVNDFEVATRKDQIAYLERVVESIEGTQRQQNKAKKLNKAKGGNDDGEKSDGQAELSRISSLEAPLGSGTLQPVIRVDGPYGSASEEVFDFRTIMLVGAGIGVTPFASIIRSIVARQKIPGSKMPTVYFYWLCRSPQEFNSFKHLMMQCVADPMLKRHFEFNLYMSGETDVTSVGFQKTLGEFRDWCHLYTGRPNWTRIFKEKKKHHEGASVGVFLCGPPAIGSALEQQCRKHSDPKHMHGATRFVMHKENF
jgi:NADPH oxidase